MVAGQRNQDEFNNFMAKDLDPKCKKCRREGVKLFLKGQKCFSPKCPIVRRNYPPGLHGQKGRRGRMTEYGQQLREKQKAKRVYGILERQFRNYYQKAIKQRGDTGEIIQQLLEMRLDNVIYRLGLAASRSQGRQLIIHGHVFVNNKRVRSPGFSVKVKDIISVREESREKANFKNLKEDLQNYQQPAWLVLDKDKLEGTVLDLPREAELPVEINLLVESFNK